MRISDWSSDVCSSDLKGERAAFTDGSVTVPFNLRETVKRSKHEPTPEELAKEEKERKRRDRRWARNDWDYVPSFSSFRHWPEWDYAPTGKVSFEIGRASCRESVCQYV